MKKLQNLNFGGFLVDKKVRCQNTNIICKKYERLM